MQNLINDIKNLKESGLKKIVEQRLKDFENFKDKSNDEWFSELCFCILTANSRARTAINIQNQIGIRGFLFSPENNIRDTIKMNKHRFHNNKAKYIVLARNFSNVKEILNGKNEIEMREWIVENVKGLGYKEASHFLRNVGFKNVAILDRHILNLMLENGNLDKRPKTLNKKNYLDIEKKFGEIADEIGMNLAELDLYMWYLKTGIVLK